MGKLVLNVEPATQTYKVKSFELKTLYADEWKPDPTTQKVINGWNKKLADIVRQPVGESPIMLTRAYGESSQLGNLFTDAMVVSAPNAQIALINSAVYELISMRVILPLAILPVYSPSKMN